MTLMHITLTLQVQMRCKAKTKKKKAVSFEAVRRGAEDGAEQVEQSEDWTTLQWILEDEQEKLVQSRSKQSRLEKNRCRRSTRKLNKLKPRFAKVAQVRVWIMAEKVKEEQVKVEQVEVEKVEVEQVKVEKVEVEQVEQVGFVLYPSGSLKGGGKETPKKPLKETSEVTPKKVQQPLKQWIKAGEKAQKVEEVKVKEGVKVKPEVKVKKAVKEEVEVKVDEEQVEQVEPDFIAKLQSCGAKARQPCKQVPPCMKHQVFAEMHTYMKVEPVAEVESEAEAEPVEAPAVEEGRDIAYFAAAGLRGLQKRKDWLETRKAAGAAKQTYKKALTMPQKELVLKYCTEHRPASFRTSNLDGDWWKEAAEFLEMDKEKIKKCWSKRVKVQKDIDYCKERLVVNVKQNKWARKRYENRTPIKTHAPGAGRPSPIAAEYKILKHRCSVEEKSYGHRLGPDDVFAIFLEVLSERCVQLMRQEKSDQLTKVQSELLARIRKKLENVADLRLSNNMKTDMLESINRAKATVQRKTVLSPAEEEVRCKLTWQDFDEMMHTCTLNEEKLKDFVCKPAEYIAHAEDWVVEFEDEVGMC